MFYKIVQIVGGFLIRTFVFRIKSEGLSNVPQEGRAILAFNHKSLWDPVIVAITTPRQMKFMSKAELFRFKPFAMLIRSLGAFPVQRGKGDVGAIKAGLSILKNEDMMLIFPEGKRDRFEETKRAKPGVALFATRAKAPVIPCYIEGKYKWFGKITVHYGEPMVFEKFYDEKPAVDELQVLADEILKKMRSLKG